MAKSSNVIGIAAILLILAAREDSEPLFSSGRNGPGGKSSHNIKSMGRGGILPSIEIGSILNDLHKLTFIMNNMDNLGQMALNPSERPKLPPPSEIISRALPDLANVVETMAPLLSILGSDSNHTSDFNEEEDYID